MALYLLILDPISLSWWICEYDGNGVYGNDKDVLGYIGLSMGEDVGLGNGLKDKDSTAVVELAGDKLPILSEDGKYGADETDRFNGDILSYPIICVE